MKSLKRISPASLMYAIVLIVGTLNLQQHIYGATLGTAEECCCGLARAEGTCCLWESCDPMRAGPYIPGLGLDCVYNPGLDGEMIDRRDGTCPDGRFECPSTIVCSPSPAPTPAPSCQNVEGFGVVDTDDKCNQACESKDLKCDDGGCGYSFTYLENDGETVRTSCACGPGDFTICEDISGDNPGPAPGPNPSASSGTITFFFMAGAGVVAALSLLI